MRASGRPSRARRGRLGIATLVGVAFFLILLLSSLSALFFINDSLVQLQSAARRASSLEAERSLEAVEFRQVAFDQNPAGRVRVVNGSLVGGGPGELARLDGEFFAVDSQPLGVLERRRFTPTDGDVLNDTQTISGGFLSLQAKDGVFWQMRAYPSKLGFTSNPYHPTAFVLREGTTLVGGSLQNLTADDGVYMSFRSAPITVENEYHPSGFNVLRGAHTGGTVANLADDDGVYMRFRSAVSFDTASTSTATIVYRDTSAGGPRFPKDREWDGTSWSSASALPDAGSNIRQVRLAFNPTTARYYEKVAVVLGDDRRLDAYVWDGTQWQHYPNLARVEANFGRSRPFDIAYETNSGRLLLVYAVDSPNPARDLAYRIWDGSSWSPEAYIDDTTTAANNRYRWVALASNPRPASNEIGILALDQSRHVNAWVWDGSSAGNRIELTTQASSTASEAIALAYEQTTGRLMVTAGDRFNRILYRVWTGSQWLSPNAFFIFQRGFWLTLKPDPDSDKLMLTIVTSNRRLHTALWDGSSWTPTFNHYFNLPTASRRPADFAWEPAGSRGILVWGTSFNVVLYRVWTGTSWSPLNFVSAVGATYWIQARTNPRDVAGDVDVLVARLTSVRDLGALKWDGSTLTNLGHNVISDNVGRNDLEAFDLRFNPFGQPTEKVEVEFTGTSDTQSWVELTWAVDSAWTVGNVQVTLQLFNFQTNSYPTSGDGFISYTSSGTPNTDELKSQTIVINPTHFRDAAGNWKIKVTGQRGQPPPFELKVDLVEFKPKAGSGFKSHVELHFSGIAQIPDKLQLTVDSAFTTGSVDVTIQLFNFDAGDWDTGVGQLTYTSSPTPNTDETKVLLIETDPADFVQAGEAKIRVVAVKLGAVQFDWKADFAELDVQVASPVEFATEWFADFDGVPSAGLLNFTLRFFGKYDANGVNQTLYALNRDTNAFDKLGSQIYPTAGAADWQNVSVTVNVRDYVSNGQLRVRALSFAAVTAPFDIFADLLEVEMVLFRDSSVVWQAVFTLNLTASQIAKLEVTYAGHASQPADLQLFLFNFSRGGWDPLADATLSALNVQVGPVARSGAAVAHYVNASRVALVSVNLTAPTPFTSFTDQLALRAFPKPGAGFVRIELKNVGGILVELRQLWVINETRHLLLDSSTTPAFDLVLSPGETQSFTLPYAYVWSSPVEYRFRVVSARGNLWEASVTPSG